MRRTGLKWKDEARTRQREVKIRGPWIQRCIDNSLTQFILFSTPLSLLDCGGTYGVSIGRRHSTPRFLKREAQVPSWIFNPAQAAAVGTCLLFATLACEKINPDAR